MTTEILSLHQSVILLPRGPYCCEKGESLRVSICDECAEMSAAYQSCLGVSPIADDDYPEFSGIYCECNEQPTIEELDSLRCDACGKQLI